MKKICLLLLILSIVTVLTVIVSAEEIFYEESSALQDGYFPEIEPKVSTFGNEDPMISALKERIIDCWTNLDEKIDIQEFGLASNEDVKNYINPIYRTLLNENPQFFYISGAVRYDTLYLYPEYKFEKEDIPTLVDNFNQAIDEALAYVDSTTMSNFDIAVALHDYLALNAVYDYETYVTNDQENPTSFSAYGILVNKLGVCQGYTLAYNLLLSRCGINVGLVSAPTEQHIWNLVEIDGNYYHVDVTWDDPLISGTAKDQTGIVYYNYFLGSDESFNNDGSHGNTWTSNMPAESQIFDNAFWKNSNANMALFDGKYYFTLKAGADFKLCSGVYTAPESYTVERTILGNYAQASNNSDSYSLSRLKMVPFVYNNRLYYNKLLQLYRYCPTLEDDELAYTYDCEHGFIVPQSQLTSDTVSFLHATFEVEGTSAVVSYSEAQSENIDLSGHSFSRHTIEPTDTEAGYTEYTCTNCSELKILDYTAPNKYLLGDINSDNAVDTADTAYLARHIAKWAECAQIQYDFNADIDDNGVINVIDLIYLSRYFASWYGYRELPTKYSA